ncbi:winged helix DNA-binding domain-containing protein [Lipingzhangella sp. LS1_29]|uniref:Winged helix DNA-binding domain-containing protein n=1 Tax=Lipingzhangella rawalii TaxID=2055835 RepID=A0ABU2H1B9_9ACTN|nr:winged helix DNA-binding domain-containing protein [Lipingzhangella rawalii]MDS1269086.1 winged helix DNA-binding domain-containing protein [Lipingzhangella rawalii]
MSDLRELARLRCVAQLLAGQRAETPAAAVAWLTAAQGQDYAGALTSIALRTRTGTRAAVEQALDAGEIVRSWPMRGTLHLVCAADLGWMLEVLTPRVLAASARRRSQLGVDESTIERARTIAVTELAAHGRLSRSQLLARWEEAGIATAGGRGYHLITYLSMTGLLCFGPTRDGEQQLVLVAEWIPQPRTVEREEALGELALRYFRSHGPATFQDFARWAQLTATDARTGVARVDGELTRLYVHDTEYLLDPAIPQRLEQCRGEIDDVLLLPGFDEFVLGYANRAAVLPSAFADRIVPGGNGVFRPTVVRDGQIVGTWRHVGTASARRIEATAFTEFATQDQARIAEVYAALPHQ